MASRKSNPGPSKSDPDPIGNEHLSPLKPRQRAFVQGLVWEGLPFLEIAKKQAIPESTAYRWMRNPVILQSIKAENHVLRQSVIASNITRLQQLRDQNKNLAAAVAAARTIAELEREAPAAIPGRTPGYVIVLGEYPPSPTAVNARPALPMLPAGDIVDVEPED